MNTRFYTSKFVLFLIAGFLTSCSNSKTFDLLFHGDASLVISNNNLNLTEGGQAGTFSISLASKPTSPVSIALAPSDLKEARISPQSISFTPDDFSTPQTITVFPLADCVADGNKNITIDTTQVNSADEAFESSIHPGIKTSIEVTVNDSLSSLPQLFIQANSPTLTTSEDGQVDKFLVALSCKPTQPVTVNLSSSNTNEGVLDKNSVTLDSTNYGLGDLVTVTGQPDCASEPDISYSINATTTSTDASFNGLSGSIGAINKNVTLTPGLLLLNSTGQLNRGAGSYNNFQVMLTCSPSTPVTMSAAVSGLVGTDYSLLSPTGASYTFDSTNWKSPADIILQILNDNTGAYSIDLTTNNVSYGPMSIAVADSGMRGVNINVTGSTGQVVLANGSNQTSFTGNNTPGIPFHWSYSVTTNYAFKIISSPPGQVCSIAEKQFGTPAIPASSINLTINCATGQMVGGRFQALEPEPLNFHLYQGKSTVFAQKNLGGLSVNFNPQGVAVLNGFVYVASNRLTGASDNQVLKLDATGAVVQTIGNGTAGASGGTPAAAQFDHPRGLVSDGNNIYVSQLGSAWNSTTNDAILKIDSAGNVTLLATSANGVLDPDGLIVVNNSLYFVSRINITSPTPLVTRNIRKLDLSTGVITDFIPTGTFVNPVAITYLNNYFYVTDYEGCKIFKFDMNGNPAVFDGTNPYIGSSCPLPAIDTFQDGAASKAKFYFPTGITTDGVNLFVTDFSGGRIRKITIDKTGGYNHIVSTIAGSSQLAGAPGTGISAAFNQPLSITSDGRSLYVSDEFSNILFKITDNGLVGYWPLAGNATDYNNNGTVNNAQLGDGITTTTFPTLNTSNSTDRFGNANQAYYFNGNSQYMLTNLAGVGSANADFSVAFWVKPAMTQNENSGFFDYDIVHNWGTSPHGYFTFRYFAETYAPMAGYIRFARYNDVGPVTTICDSGMSIRDGRYHHIAGMKKGAFLYLYIDGKQVCKVADAVTTTTVGNVAFGSRQPSNTTNKNDFTGNIADIRIYNRALNEGEVNELAQDAKPYVSGDPNNTVGASYSTGATGLLSQYSFSGAVNGANASDSGPLGNLLSSCTWAGGVCNTGSQTAVTGKDGDPAGAYQLNGTTQNFISPNQNGLPAGISDRTLCAWIKPSSYPLGSWFSGVAGYGNTTSAGSAFYIGIEGRAPNAGKLSVYFVFGDFSGNFIPPLNAWSHVCATMKNGFVQLWANGQADGTPVDRSSVSTILASGDMLGAAFGGYFNGAIDGVRIYNNALSAEQIRQLATQVPAGLVAHYDFTGDAKDVSGWGNNATSVSATLTTDRLSQSGTAYHFAQNSSQSISIPHTSILNPKGNASYSLWVRPNSLPTSGNAVFLLNKDIYGTGYGLELYHNSATGQQEIVWITPGAVGPHFVYTLPLNKYSHIVVTQTGTTSILYVNGASAPVTSGTPSALTTTTTSNLIIGGPYYFDGDIDDIQIYNRVLTPGEIHELHNIHNIIFVTASAFNGAMTRSDSTPGTGLTGIAKADNWCNTDSNMPVGATYKAILTDGTNRAGCTSNNCITNGITEHIDWPIASNTIYYRPDGTMIFTANANGVWDFLSSWTNPIEATGRMVWTGLNCNWTTGINANNWTEGAGATTPSAGISSGKTCSNNIINGTSVLYDYLQWSSISYPIYCVEQ